MPKLVTNDVADLSILDTAKTTINNNFAAVETAMEKTLSRDGTAPNEMEVSLDMNNNRIYNLGNPTGDHDAVSKSYVDTMLSAVAGSEIDIELGLAKASTSEELYNAIAVGVKAIIPASVDEIVIDAGHAPSIAANLPKIESVGLTTLKFPSGVMSTSGTAIGRYAYNNANLTLSGEYADTTLNSVVSVTPVTDGFEVVYNVADASNFIVGGVLFVRNASPLPLLASDDIVLLNRKRPLRGELSTPSASAFLGTAFVTAGSPTVTFANTPTAMSDYFSVGDLIHIKGQTRVISALGANTVTVSTNFSQSATATRGYWSSRANTGTISTSGSSTTVNGSGTSFTTEFNANDILVVNGEMRRIETIVDNVTLTVSHAINITSASPFSALVAAVLHEGAHTITAIAGNNVTCLVRSKVRPPVIGVTAADVRCVKTVWENTLSSGHGLIGDQNGALREITNIAIRGAYGDSGSFGFITNGNYDEGVTQLGGTSTVALGEGACVVDFGRLAMIGAGSVFLARKAAFSGSRDTAVWAFEGSDSQFRQSTISGAGNTSLQINANASVKGTTMRIIGGGADGVRVLDSGSLYAEIPFIMYCVGAGIRVQGGVAHINEGVVAGHTAFATRVEGGRLNAQRAVIASCKNIGNSLIEDGVGLYTGAWITGHTSRGVSTTFARADLEEAALMGNVTQLYAEEMSMVHARSARMSGTVAINNLTSSVIDATNADFGGGSVTSNNGNAKTWVKGATNFGTLSPATLNRADSNGNIIDAGSDVSTVPQFAGLDLNGTGLTLTGVATASIAANQGSGGSGEFIPTGFASASTIRATSTAGFSVFCLGGAAAPPSNGMIKILSNTGANNIVLVTDDGANGTAAYRFKFLNNVTLGPSQAIMLVYDGSQSRWTMLGKTNQATSTASGEVTLATNAETITGTEASKVVTPVALASAITPRTLATSVIQAGRLVNGTINATAAAGALTIALQTHAAATPTSTTPAFIRFPSGTVISVTAANTLVLSSGSTLGLATSQPVNIWVVGFNDNGTLRLGAINCLDSDLNVYCLQEGHPASSTAEGGAGAADSSWTFYTGTAVTDKEYVILARLTWVSGFGTPGTWATPSGIAQWTAGMPKPGDAIGSPRRTVVNTVVQSATTAVTPNDDTIPQISEGHEFITRTFRPTSAANLLRIHANAMFTCDAASRWVIAHIHKDSEANATASMTQWIPTNANTGRQMEIIAIARAVDTNEATWRLRAGYSGASGQTVTMNGAGATRTMGGSMGAFLCVQEIQT